MLVSVINEVEGGLDPETDQSKKKRKGGVEHERGGGKSGNKSVVSSKKTRFTIHIKIRGTKPGNSLHFKGERRRRRGNNA